MTRAASMSVLGSEFDAFLFEPIGEDSNGMRLSVLSMLARLDLDPWHEAAKLAGLPGETAAQNLASIIAAQPDMPSARRDPGEIAARLTALLPRSTGSGVASLTKRVSVHDVTKLRAGVYMYAVLIVFMLVSQWIVASRQPPAQHENLPTPASNTASPHLPSASLSR